MNALLKHILKAEWLLWPMAYVYTSEIPRIVVPIWEIGILIQNAGGKLFLDVFGVSPPSIMQLKSKKD